MTQWRQSTWGDEISLEYGKSLRDYTNAIGPVRVYGSNGPIGYTDSPLANGPGVILGRKGAYRGVEFSKGPFFVIDTAYYVAPKTNLNMRWIYFAIKHHKLGEIDDGSPIPSTTRAAVYVRDLEVPDITEQRAIAAMLGALDDKIELNNRMNATLEAAARALFKSWFVDFDPVKAKMAGNAPFGMDAATAALFPARLTESELGDIPDGWTVKLFKDAVNFYNSKRVPLSGREREQRRGDYRYYGATSVMDYVDDYLFDGTYVLVGEDGSVITEKGFPFLQYVWGKFWVNNHAHILQGKNGWSTEAIYLILAQSNIQHLVTGAVQPKLSMGNLSALKFICPSPQIAKAFCEQIGVFFEKRKLISNENAELERTRDYLLPKLISGEIRIPDAEKFVEGLV